jgi:phosphoglucosamine mutase
VIFRDLATTGDGILTGVVLLDIMARRGARLETLAARAMTRLPQVLVNVTVRKAAAEVAAAVAPDVTDAEQRLGRTGRVLVRPSGTEPLVRVMVEAASHDEADAVARELATAVQRAAAANGG